MRFITEFEIKESEWTKPEVLAHARKQTMGMDLGLEISKCFDWQNKAENPNLYSLEIEAFPIDKWVEFKQKLFSHFQVCAVHNMAPDGNKILSIFEELESYDKPSGDTIINNI